MSENYQLFQNFASVNLTIYNSVLEIKDLKSINEIIKNPKCFFLIILFLIGILYAFLAIRMKLLTFTFGFSIVVYTLLKHFEKKLGNLPARIDKSIRPYCSNKIKELFGEEKNFVIGFIVLTVVIVFLCLLIKNIIKILTYISCAYFCYFLYSEIFKPVAENNLLLYEIVGVMIATMFIMFFVNWIFDLGLNLLFSFAGSTIIISFIVAYIGNSEYKKFLIHVEGLDLITAIDYNGHKKILLLLFLGTCASFLFQMKILKKN